MSLWRWDGSPKTRLSQPEIPLVVFEELFCWTRTARACRSLPVAPQRASPRWWTYCFSNPAGLCQTLSSHLLRTHKVIVGALACEERGQALWKPLLNPAKRSQKPLCLGRSGAGAGVSGRIAACPCPASPEHPRCSRCPHTARDRPLSPLKAG